MSLDAMALDADVDFARQTRRKVSLTCCTGGVRWFALNRRASMITKMRHLSGIAGLCPRPTTAALVLASLLMAAVVATQPMQAQTFHLLYAFNGSDGADAVASLIRDSGGNLYGTTAEGGGAGTVFRLDKTRKLTVLHSFTGEADSSHPMAALLRDSAGNLYGTTYDGIGDGTVFKIDPSGTKTVLHRFSGTDGMYPQGSLVRDESSNLYGTTTAGGAVNWGTVFKLDTSGALTTLYTFTGGTDGSLPMGSVVRDAAGNLYGTCASYSTGPGTVWKLDTTGMLTVLHTFDGTDGQGPAGGLIADAAGNLYGTTVAGGSSDAGTVFRIAKKNGSFSLLHDFAGGSTGPEGGLPFGTLARDSAGNLYGTNVYGGGGCSPRGSGCGTVWKLDTNNQLTVLTNFGKGNQGKTPYGGVVLDKAGNLYGTTSRGGSRHCSMCGTVFKITP
jgi:uncharacterized repeat protein (TIGR03803 family)